MKKLSSVLAILMAILMLFTSCKGGENEGDTTSSTKKQGLFEKTTEVSTSKYSKDDKLIALTFDDGPGYESSKKIQKILKENDAVATFFVVGYMLEEHPEIVKSAFENGNEIGNHSYNHKYLTKCSPEEIRSEIHSNNDKIKEIIGEDCKLFRAPGGNTKNILQYIDMPLIGWSIDTNDWKKKDSSNKNRTAEQREADINKVVDHILNNASKGQIVLMHEIYDFTADVTEKVVPRLVEEGYKLVTVSEMFDAYGVKLENGVIYREAKATVPVSGVGGAPAAGEYVVATSSDNLNIRAEADPTSSILGTIPTGTSVTVTESVEGWAKVTYGGVTGWVSTKFLAEKQ